MSKKSRLEARLDWIGWIYLVYVLAPKVDQPFICKSGVRQAGVDLLRTHRHLCKECRKEDLSAFARDLTKYLETTIQHEDAYVEGANEYLKIVGANWHSETGLELHAEMRHKIAYKIVVALTHREFWWRGSPSEDRVRILKHAHKISHEESEEFLRKLVRDVHRLDKKFQPLAAPH